MVHSHTAQTMILATGSALALITAALGDHAQAESSLDASYTISFARIRVGDITATVVFGDTEYAMSARGLLTRNATLESSRAERPKLGHARAGCSLRSTAKSKPGSGHLFTGHVREHCACLLRGYERMKAVSLAAHQFGTPFLGATSKSLTKRGVFCSGCRAQSLEQAWRETEMILRDPAPRAVEGR